MTMPAIRDAALPGLLRAAEPGALAPAIDRVLDAATAATWRCAAASIARFRYRSGNRAILQLDLTLAGPGGRQRAVPGALWLYKGNKARHAAAKAPPCRAAALPDMVFEPCTGGLLTLFPCDRRVPEVGRFAACPDSFARVLTGSEALSPPEVSRYRPGLGATFRWRTAGGTSFVKIFNDRPALDRYRDLSRLRDRLKSPTLSTPEPQGLDGTICAVALKQADGLPLADCLGGQDRARAIDTVLGGLEALNGAQISPGRAMDCAGLLKRARSVVGLLDAVDGGLAASAAEALDRLGACPPTLRQLPVHMDMKIEHVLIDGTTACLLDMDSLALSDPLYDSAMLAARIELAGLEETLPQADCAAAIERLRAAAGGGRRPVFDWLFCVARFQTARFVLQNIRPGWPDHIAALMRRVTARTPDPAPSE